MHHPVTTMEHNGDLTLVSTLDGHIDRVWNVDWNPTGTILATCGGDKTVLLWAKDGGEESWRLVTRLEDGHNRTIRSVSWSPCGNFLASSSFDATTVIWDRRDGQWTSAATLEGHENEVKSISWSVSGNFLATCSRDKSVWIWEVADDHEYECASVLTEHTQDVKVVLWHPTEDIVVSGSYDNTIKIWREGDDGDEWTCIQTLDGHTSTVWDIAFNSQGDEMISCSDDLSLRLWHRYSPANSQGVPTNGIDCTWRIACVVSGEHERTIYSVSWSPLNGLIATSGADDYIRLFKREGDVTTDGTISLSLVAQQPRAHKQDINCVRFCPSDAKLLASCSDDKLTKIWNIPEELTLN